VVILRFAKIEKFTKSEELIFFEDAKY